jgi:hypothetical protein
VGGTGVSQGRPVFVLIFRTGARTYEVFVVARNDCSVLRRAALP